MTTHERAAAAVRAIGERARRANLDRAEVLDEALEAVRGGTLDEEHRTAARTAAHQLAGSAGTFGYPRASELGGRLGAYFRNGAAPDDLARAAGWLRDLSEALGSEPDDDEVSAEDGSGSERS